MRKAVGFLNFVGPGLLVTVGLIDPGNRASNVAAGVQYGYLLLRMVTLATFILVVLFSAIGASVSTTLSDNLDVVQDQLTIRFFLIRQSPLTVQFNVRCLH